MNRGKGSRQVPILRLLADGTPRTCRQISTELDIPPGTTAKVIEGLWRWGQDDGLVTAIGVGPRGARTYTLSAAGREQL